MKFEKFNAQLYFIERAAQVADGLGHFYKLFSDGKAYKHNSPSTMLVICQTGIRLHKYDLNQTESFPKLQFEYDWNGIASFEIQVHINNYVTYDI